MEVYHIASVNASAHGGNVTGTMTVVRPDFLKECMSDVGQAPLDEFNRVFCVRCQNPECVRSGGNHSLFKKRVTGWKEALFDQVPRASEDDPRYAKIRAKRFLPVGQPRPQVVVSTANLPVIEASKMPKPRVPAPPAQEADPPAPHPEPAPAPATAPTTTAERPVPPPVPAPAPRQVGDMQNTPFVQGTVLKGADPVEKPGSTFVFDDE